MAQAASSPLLACRLYRSLLRAAKPFTSPSPNAAVLLSLLQRTGIDDHINDWEAFVSADGSSVKDKARNLAVSYAKLENGEVIPPNKTYQRLFRRLLREVVTGQEGTQKMLWPSQADTIRLLKVIRREFRNSADGSQSIHFDVKTRMHVGFRALREINKKLSYFEQLQESAPTPVPDQAAWNVSSLPTFPPSAYLRPGVFLVSHPYMNDSFFGKTVICLLEHEEDDATVQAESDIKRGTYRMPGQTFGLIVNRVSINAETGNNRTLREAFEENLLPGRLADVFGDTIVREGGPVHVSLQMVHSLRSSQDESKIGGRVVPMVPEGDESPAMYSDKGVFFQGQIFKAMNAVEDGSLDRENVSFFVGASTWSPGQLANEVAQGYWMPFRGPPEIALTGICEHNPAASENSGKRPLADLWLSMLSSSSEVDGRLAHMFHHEEWDEYGMPCDAFDDEDELVF